MLLSSLVSSFASAQRSAMRNALLYANFKISPPALQLGGRSILIGGLVAEDVVAGRCDRCMRPCYFNALSLMLFAEASAGVSLQTPPAF